MESSCAACIACFVALIAGCGASPDLRRHGEAFGGRTLPAERPSAAEIEDAVAAGQSLEPVSRAEAERRVANGLAWLEWLRVSGWLDRLSGDACAPRAVEVARDEGDLIGTLPERVSPPGCDEAREVVRALGGVRDRLERAPFPGAVAPLRAAIAELAGPCPATEPDPIERAARRYVWELALLGAPGCPSGGWCATDRVRVGPAAPLGTSGLGDQPGWTRGAVPEGFSDPRVVEVVTLGRHAAEIFTLLVARLGEELRVVRAREGGQVDFHYAR